MPITLTRVVAAIGLAATLASAALAQNYIGITPEMMEDNTIRLDIVSVEQAGTLVVYDFGNGEYGDVLGQTPLNAGANADVLVVLSRNAQRDVAAVIYAGEPTTPADSLFMLKIDIDM